MYTMYMKQYTVAEFRKDLRNALNAVENGDMVVITRHNTSFVLTTASHWNKSQASALNGVTRLVVDTESSDIKPDLQHVSENGFMTLGSNPKKINRLATPTTLEDKLAAMSEGERQEVERKKAEQDEVDSRLTKFAKEKGMKFCGNGHAIPAGRSKCMGKGCKYA